MKRSAAVAHRLAPLLVPATLLWLTACGGSENAEATSADPKACAAYISAYCVHEERCQRQDEASCNAQLGGTTCLNSDQLSSCSDSLFYSIDCQHDPSGCGLEKIANRPHEQKLCEDFVAKACAYYERCGTYADSAACQAALLSKAHIDCNKAIGSSAALSDCEAALGSAGCAAPPDSCATVIAFLETGS